jgi:hypothetical protein
MITILALCYDFIFFFIPHNIIKINNNIFIKIMYKFIINLNILDLILIFFKLIISF